jgi:hypothetical protein
MLVAGASWSEGFGAVSLDGTPLSQRAQHESGFAGCFLRVSRPSQFIVVVETSEFVIEARSSDGFVNLQRVEAKQEARRACTARRQRAQQNDEADTTQLPTGLLGRTLCTRQRVALATASAAPQSEPAEVVEEFRVDDSFAPTAALFARAFPAAARWIADAAPQPAYDDAECDDDDKARTFSGDL